MNISKLHQKHEILKRNNIPDTLLLHRLITGAAKETNQNYKCYLLLRIHSLILNNHGNFCQIPYKSLPPPRNN